MSSAMDNAKKLSSLENVWKNALTQLNVMSEASDDPDVSNAANQLMIDMRAASLPGESHHRFAEFLYNYCKLLDIDMKRVESECSHSHDELMMAEQEIEALETLKEAAEAWAKVYAARYGVTS